MRSPEAFNEKRSRATLSRVLILVLAARAAMNRHLDRFEQRLERALQLVETKDGAARQGRLAALANQEQQTR